MVSAEVEGGTTPGDQVGADVGQERACADDPDHCAVTGDPVDARQMAEFAGVQSESVRVTVVGPPRVAAIDAGAPLTSHAPTGPDRTASSFRSQPRGGTAFQRHTRPGP